MSGHGSGGKEEILPHLMLLHAYTITDLTLYTRIFLYICSVQLIFLEYIRFIAYTNLLYGTIFY
jgi:hypothetical protein